jgi:putative inorganic carbon (HCO3(-)) transporter
VRRFLPFEPWLVGGLALAAVAYEPFLPYAVAGALLLLLLGWMGGRPLRAERFHIPLILLLGMVAVSAWVTPLPGVTAQQSLRLLLGVLLALSLAVGLDSRSRLKWALVGVLVMALLLAASGLLFVNWYDKFRFLPKLSTLLPRLQSALDTTEHPNVEGGYLAILLAGLLAWGVFRWKGLHWGGRIGLGLAESFIGSVLVLTQARTALLALAVGMGLLFILRWRRGWIPVALGLVLLLALFFYIGPQQVWYSLGGETGGVATFGARENFWLRARLIIQDFPFTGIGMGTFGEVVDVFYPLAAQPVHIPHAHNLFLQIAVDLGLPGLLAWLGCWGTVLWSAWRLYRSQALQWRTLGAAALCSQVALGVGGLLDCTVWDNRPAVIIWGLWGLILAAERIMRKEGTSNSSGAQPEIG